MQLSQLQNELRSAIPTIPDFPKPGILFYDVTAVMRDPSLFHHVTKTFAERFRSTDFDAVVGIDARGFIFGAALAYEMNKPFVPVRKPGKLPPEVEKIYYVLEYGEGELEIRKDAVKPGDKVIVIDDLLATGGTAKGTVELLQRIGAEVLECCFVVELPDLNGRAQLGQVESFSIIQYAGA
ncbi:MAG: adenine phosphoribosyltransferase [Bdellovibrionales bacterium]|nr:adenine phosphoribosyltransferase [Bdellovibrionales bacterium]